MENHYNASPDPLYSYLNLSGRGLLLREGEVKGREGKGEKEGDL